MKEIATLNNVYIVTYYLDLRNAIPIYYISHIFPINIKLVDWILWNNNNFYLVKNYIKRTKIKHCVPPNSK